MYGSMAQRHIKNRQFVILTIYYKKRKRKYGEGAYENKNLLVRHTPKTHKLILHE